MWPSPLEFSISVDVTLKMLNSPGLNYIAILPNRTSLQIFTYNFCNWIVCSFFLIMRIFINPIAIIFNFRLCTIVTCTLYLRFSCRITSLSVENTFMPCFILCVQFLSKEEVPTNILEKRILNFLMLSAHRITNNHQYSVTFSVIWFNHQLWVKFIIRIIQIFYSFYINSWKLILSMLYFYRISL